MSVVNGLNDHTVHIHDLYFLELFAPLTSSVVPFIALEEVNAPRRHEQRFNNIRAVSLLDAATALGGERGRVPTFAKNQYHPFTAHFRDGDQVHAAGVKLGDATTAVDVTLLDSRSMALVAHGSDNEIELHLVMSSEPTIARDAVHLGPLELRFSHTPDDITVTEASPPGHVVNLTWTKNDIEASGAIR